MLIFMNGILCFIQVWMPGWRIRFQKNVQQRNLKKTGDNCERKIKNLSPFHFTIILVLQFEGFDLYVACR